MPVAGAIKLDITADANDKASAVLRGVRGELKRNETAIQAVSAAGKENADISDILARGSGKERSGIVAEVAAREKAVRVRREAVQAAREAAAAGAQGAGANDRVTGSLSRVFKAQEGLNRVLGLAGFVGIAGAAVSGVVSIVEAVTNYHDALTPVRETQERFNALLAEMQGRTREFEVGRMGDFWAGIAKATDDLEKQKTQWLEFDALQEHRLSAIIQLQVKIKKIEADIEFGRKSGQQTASGTHQRLFAIAALTRDLIPLEREYAAGKEASRKASEQIVIESERANVALQLGRSLSQGIADNLDSATGFAEGLGKAVTTAFKDAHWNPFGIFGKSSEEQGKELAEAEKKKEKEREAAERRRASGGESASVKRDREAKALAETEQRIRHENDLLELGLRYQDDYHRKLAALALDQEALDRDLSEKRIARSTYELEQRRLDLQMHLAINEETARARDAEAKAAEEDEKKREETHKRAVTRIEAEKRLHEKSLEEAGKRVEGIGAYASLAVAPLDQLSGRLAGVADFVSQSAGEWAKYAAGQTKVGEAVASTIGFMGGAIAQAITDKRAQAAVEGGFETAASIASFATGNVPAGIAHAAAAAAYFGVAATGGAKSAGGSVSGAAQSSNVVQGNFGGSRGGGSRESAPTMVVHHYGQGIVYGLGQDVARVQESTRERLRYTGHRGGGL